MLKYIKIRNNTLQTINACIASHSWGDWILCANSLTDICGLKNIRERNNPIKSWRPKQRRVWVIMGFSKSSTQWAYISAKLDGRDSVLWETLSWLNECDHTLPAPYWFGHKTPLCTPSLPVCWRGWWLCLKKRTGQFLIISPTDLARGHTCGTHACQWNANRG